MVQPKYPTRQKGPHVHGLTIDGKGTIYICDLGSDAIWIAESKGSGLEVVGMMDRSRGDTPRHALVSDDGKSSLLPSKTDASLFSLLNSTRIQISSYLPIPSVEC